MDFAIEVALAILKGMGREALMHAIQSLQDFHPSEFSGPGEPAKPPHPSKGVVAGLLDHLDIQGSAHLGEGIPLDEVGAPEELISIPIEHVHVPVPGSVDVAFVDYSQEYREGYKMGRDHWEMSTLNDILSLEGTSITQDHRRGFHAAVLARKGGEVQQPERIPSGYEEGKRIGQLPMFSSVDDWIKHSGIRVGDHFRKGFDEGLRLRRTGPVEDKGARREDGPYRDIARTFANFFIAYPEWQLVKLVDGLELLDWEPEPYPRLDLLMYRAIAIKREERDDFRRRVSVADGIEPTPKPAGQTAGRTRRILDGVSTAALQHLRDSEDLGELLRSEMERRQTEDKSQ